MYPEVAIPTGGRLAGVRVPTGGSIYSHGTGNGDWREVRAGCSLILHTQAGRKPVGHGSRADGRRVVHGPGPAITVSSGRRSDAHGATRIE